jgi:YHS domain-containing protein
MKTLASTILLFGALAAAPLSAALAADELNVSLGHSIAGKPLAMHGYDPVAYFTLGRPTRGSDTFVHVHDGAAYRFASRENLDAFKANPARYAPAYGGFCAYGVALGKKFDGDPNLWRIVGNIQKADSRWKDIAAKPVSSL